MDKEGRYTAKWTYDPPVTTHNWPTLTWESVVRDESRKPVAIALGSNEKEPLDRALLFCSAQEMAHLIREALPQLRWGNVYGARCDELIAEAEALLTKIGETP